MTELHQAAAAGDGDGVEEILLQKKCNPNQRDVDWSYKTALHWAAAKGAQTSAASIRFTPLVKTQTSAPRTLTCCSIFLSRTIRAKKSSFD